MAACLGSSNWFVVARTDLWLQSLVARSDLHVDASSVSSAIVGLMSFWQSKGEAMQAIGALDYPTEERKRLAKLFVPS